MRNAILLFPFLILCGVAEAQPQPLKAPLKSVTLYLGAGELFHQTTAQLPAGVSEMVIGGLSDRILPNSIRVKADRTTKVLAVSTHPDTTSADTAMKSLMNKLQSAQDQVDYLKQRAALFEEEKSLLQANREIGGNQGFSAEQLRQMADFYRQRMGNIQDSLLSIKNQVRLAETTLQQVRDQYFVEQERYGRPLQAAHITVSTESAGLSTIELNYLVSHAQWRPEYTIRAVDPSEPILLELNSKIFNHTGIDWKEVPITLSSGDPTQGAKLPALTTWALNWNAGNIDKTGVVFQYNRNQIQLNDIPLAAAAPVDFGEASDLMTVNNTAVEYRIPQPYNLPADAVVRTVPVENFTLQASWSHLAIPREDRSAYLIAEVGDWESLNLMEAPLHVYNGGSYQGEAVINPNSLRDSLYFSLGRDNQVTILRGLIKDKSSKKFLSGQITENFTYEILLKNNRKQAIEIEMQDQVPVSQESDIVVEIQERSGGRQDEATGKITWNYTLQPGAEKRVLLSFSVRYPRNKTLDLQLKGKRLVNPRYF